MAKDPALLWYFSDWHSGTILMTRFLKGCYMDLLHAQFNHGRLSLEEIKTCLGSDFGPSWPTLQKKFKQDGTGLFFNERLEHEKNLRKSYCESRGKNRKGKSYDQSHENHMSPHMENENRNENVIKNEVKGVQGETFETRFERTFNELKLDELKCSFPDLDISAELNHFRIKCNSAKADYHTRNPDGLRLGFLKQLEHSPNKKKQNGRNGKKHEFRDEEILS